MKATGSPATLACGEMVRGAEVTRDKIDRVAEEVLSLRVSEVVEGLRRSSGRAGGLLRYSRILTPGDILNFMSTWRQTE